jgi:hypothetical protein
MNKAGAAPFASIKDSEVTQSIILIILPRNLITQLKPHLTKMKGQ